MARANRMCGCAEPPSIFPHGYWGNSQTKPRAADFQRHLNVTVRTYRNKDKTGPRNGKPCNASIGSPPYITRSQRRNRGGAANGVDGRGASSKLSEKSNRHETKRPKQSPQEVKKDNAAGMKRDGNGVSGRPPTAWAVASYN